MCDHLHIFVAFEGHRDNLTHVDNKSEYLLNSIPLNHFSESHKCTDNNYRKK